MEKLRSEKHTAAVLKIQKRVRGWLAKRRYAKLRRAILAMQRLGRGFLARQCVFFAEYLNCVNYSTVIYCKQV